MVAAWLVIAVIGMFTAGQAADRFTQRFSVPGYSAYETNKRIHEQFGNGRNASLVAVLQSDRDITTVPGVEGAIAKAAAENPGSRVASWFTTGSDAYLSKDRRTMFATIVPAGEAGFEGPPTVKATRAALQDAAPPGVTAHLTGRDAIELAAAGDSANSGPSVLTEAVIGGVLTIVVLLIVFGTLPAVLLPLATAVASILFSFTLVLGLTYLTDVSLILEFLIALLGLGIAVDYCLLILFRFRDELRAGRTVTDAVEETMAHAGRAVVVSGSTVAIGLLALVAIPVPFIASLGVGGMIIPMTAAAAAITLLPALLSILGHRVNSLRVLPKRLTEGNGGPGLWRRWSRLVMRRPLATAVIGLAATAALVVPALSVDLGEPVLANRPGAGDAIQGREALRDAGISPGVMKPLVIAVEGDHDPADVEAVRAAVAGDPGVVGAAVPRGWSRPGITLIEAFTAGDASGGRGVDTITRLREELLPETARDVGARVSLGGITPEERDFIRAVYSSAPLALGIVIVLTFILLMRAFRSVLLPIKAVVLNLVSLAAALGVAVFIFQEGHGSMEIWNVHATGSIPSWVPIMVFAFLYGVSMDYEVFMLSRVREEYDRRGSTALAVTDGLAAIGRLITSAAVILMLVFFVLSLSPGADVKIFGIGLAAGVIIDATLIRALLVPSLMQLLKGWNWWLPAPLARLLRVKPSRASMETT
ncbi:MAG: MMPL family transporter [Actinomycetota bacterium]